MTEVRIPLPVFALLAEEATGVVFFNHPQYLILPLFTSPEDINLFRLRHMPACTTLQIATPADLHSFLQGPQGEWNSLDSCRVMFDPVEMAVDSNTISVDRTELINACAPTPVTTRSSSSLPSPMLLV